MTTYEIVNLFISGFAAIGTCGATILALYFWYRDEALNLRFHGAHAEAYGSVQNIDGGYLVLRLTNTGYRPISLELVGIKFIKGCCFRKKYTIVDFSMQNNNLTKNRLPTILQHGESYMYVTPWDLFLDLCRANEFRKISVYAYVSSLRKEIKFKLGRDILDDLDKELCENRKDI
ncbi:hypothetical protein [Legionella pneumophila]|jgi:hypothetical protein|uniref:hypothetical protein n=1 Tax=Legionella pneumophila TaxID=446 RepID=UPI001A2DAAA2|nr:hypothetical protein [Legionella pneumophila]HDP0033871.1 hypothetical protein [Legionella pneumophila]HEN4769131.1 hypothetical protein [Legionella pneumophila]